MKEKMMMEVTKQDLEFLCNLCDMELIRIENKRYKTDDIKVFDEIYSGHISEIKRLKKKIEGKMKNFESK